MPDETEKKQPHESQVSQIESLYVGPGVKYATNEKGEHFPIPQFLGGAILTTGEKQAEVVVVSLGGETVPALVGMLAELALAVHGMTRTPQGQPMPIVQFIEALANTVVGAYSKRQPLIVTPGDVAPLPKKGGRA